MLTSFFSIVVVLALLEGAVRLLVDESLYLFSNVSDDWVVDEEIGYKNKPDYSEIKLHKNKMVELHTNADGLQPAALKREKMPGVKRVLLIGNSTVFARDVPENEKIHYYLDSLLDASGRQYEVINAGVTGYSTDQALLTLKRYVKIYQPDYVAYNYCINDLYANAKDMYWQISKPHYVLENGELKLIPAQPEKTNLDQNTWSLRNLIQYSALYGLLRPYIQRVRMKYSRQAVLDQGGAQNLGVYDKTAEEEPLFLLLEKLMVEMQRTCKENGAVFFAYSHPELVTVWPPYREAIGQTDVNPFAVENKLKEIATRNHFPFVGMVQVFLNNPDRGPFHLLPNDPHCNGEGYRLQAEVLSGFILNYEKQKQIKNENRN